MSWSSPLMLALLVSLSLIASPGFLSGTILATLASFTLMGLILIGDFAPSTCGEEPETPFPIRRSLPKV